MNEGSVSFDHYSVFVADLERSARFYAEVLGLRAMAEPFADGLHVWFAIGGGAQLHLITPRHTTIAPTADVHFAFRTASLDGFVARLEELGVGWGDLRPGEAADGRKRIRPDGIPQIYFQDPDGYWIEVNQAKG